MITFDTLGYGAHTIILANVCSIDLGMEIIDGRFTEHWGTFVTMNNGEKYQVTKHKHKEEAEVDRLLFLDIIRKV